MIRMLAAVAMLACAATPLGATEIGGRSTEIAERRLRHQLNAEPDCPVATARLARHYLANDRRERAVRLYRSMLAMDDVALETQDGRVVSSHALADAALRKAAERPRRLVAR